MATYRFWKRNQVRAFKRTIGPRIKRWRRTMLPLLFEMGEDVIKAFDRKFKSSKDVGWLGTKAEEERPVTTLGSIGFPTAVWIKCLEDAARPLHAEALETAANRVLADLSTGAPPRIDILGKQVQEELGKMVVEHSKFVVEGTEKIVQEQIRIGRRLGETIPEIRDRLVTRLHPDDFKITGRFTSIHHRAETIARTEAVRANNLGNRIGMLKFGVNTRIWITMGDSLVRDEHGLMDGRELDVNKPWVLPFTGETMWFPMAVQERCTEGPGRVGTAPGPTGTTGA